MGYFGHGLYDGDDTQTRHYDFIKWTKIEDYKDQCFDEEWLGNKTTIPKEKHKQFCANLNLILKEMPKKQISPKNNTYTNKSIALEWIMLAKLFMDNKLKVPRIVIENSKTGAEVLMGEDASDFCNPSLRRRHLRKFIDNLEK